MISENYDYSIGQWEGKIESIYKGRNSFSLVIKKLANYDDDSIFQEYANITEKLYMKK